MNGSPGLDPYRMKDGKAPYWGDGNGAQNEKMDAWKWAEHNSASPDDFN